MLTKNQIKYYSSLLQKKYRKEYHKFIVEGEILINEAFNSNYNCDIIIASYSYAEKKNSFINIIHKKGILVEIVNQNLFEKFCDTRTPQGIIGVFEMPKKIYSFDSIVKENFIVALENISDPGNLGTIIRNCDWFGVQTIFLSADCAEVYNPKVIRASAGSIFHINFYELENFYDVIGEMKKNGFRIYCSDLTGENIYSLRVNKKFVVFFSNEANGPTERLINISDKRITIPRFGKAESLNVASASAVVLSELLKKNLL